MSRTTPFNRMPRIQESLPEGEVRIPAPPNVGAPPRLSWFQMLLPLAGVFVMVGVYGGIRGDWILAIPMVALSGLSATASIVGRLTQRRDYHRRVEEAERAYAAALDQKRTELERLRREQQRIRADVDPDLETLLARAQERDPRLWERRPTDPDFLSVRLGLGQLPSSVAVAAPHPDMPDPRLEEALALEAEYSRVPQVPVTASLLSGPLGLAGPLEERIEVARALLANIAVHHSPDEVHLLAIYSPQRKPEWAWLQWLPHTHALGDGRRSYLAGDSSSTEYVLKHLLEELHRRQNRLYALQHGQRRPAWPWLLLLVDEYPRVHDDPAIHLLLSSEGRELGVTGVFLVDRAAQVPMGCSAVAQIQADGQLAYSVAGEGGWTLTCWPERATEGYGERVARSLAPLQVRGLRAESDLPSSVHLLDLMAIRDVSAHDVAAGWKRRSPERYLRVPIGQRRGDQPLILDLDHTGHGPHGLIAGTTGSGKSELLQTLVVALALTHHPHDVGFVLVDFKGGGAFSGLTQLPHTQGLVTDLSGKLAQRALVALRAEMDRRKRLFNAVDVNDIGLYQQLHWRGQVDEPLPRLIVIIDEFAELVSDYPDFMDGLIAIARVGRSLGLHLILATQSPTGVVKQQIWANAKFRICLRVESRQESVEMLRRPEAANLPRIPGRGYLQVGNNDVFELFQVARVGGVYRDQASDRGLQDEQQPIVIAEISPLGQRRVLFDSQGGRAAHSDPGDDLRTDLDVVVQRLAEEAQRMGLHKLPSPWPDPLPDRVFLPDLLLRERYPLWDGVDAALGRPERRESSSRARPWLGALVGLLDDPANQRQVPLRIDLARQDGQLLVFGAPGSGKRMWVRTLVLSLACTHTPEELHFYLLEFGGKALGVLDPLPHVADVLSPLDGERVRRLLRCLLDALDERKRMCSEAGVDGLVRLRESGFPQAPPAIVVVITGFVEFRALFQEEMLQLTRLIREGGPYGIHLVLVGDRAGDVPMTISSVVARRVALRLAEADEYHMVLGARVRAGKDECPRGRGWYGRPPLEFQTAVPGRAAGEGESIAELRRIAERMDRAWEGVRPDPVKALREEIPLSEILADFSPSSARCSLVVPVGLEGLRLRRALVDLVEQGPHFIVSSTPQGGKTTLLLSWSLALAECYSPERVQLVFVSGRRGSLAPLRRLPHTLDYCRTPEDFCDGGVLDRLLTEVSRRERMLSEGGDLDGLPHLVLMIDDYDEFFYGVGEQPAVQEGLSDLAKQARDVNAHIVVSGPLPDMGGILFRDPLLKQMRLGRSGFVLRMLDPNEQNPLGLRLRASSIGPMRPGRGYVVRNGFDEAVQVAIPGAESVGGWAARLKDSWAESAQWPQLSKGAESEKDGDGVEPSPSCVC